MPEEIKKKKWGRLGVDTDGDFKPYYVVPDDKRKNVAELKAALKGASEVMLATDPDREGESISWHLLEVLKPKVPVKRIVFHEITEEGRRAGDRATRTTSTTTWCARRKAAAFSIGSTATRCRRCCGRRCRPG